MDNVTTKGRDVWINLRVNLRIREEFKLAADLRGASMSGLLHQFIVRTIREEKEKSPVAFEALPQEEHDGPQPSHVYDAIAGTPKAVKNDTQK